MNEDILRENLLSWFKSSKKGDGDGKSCFWRLYQIRSMQSEITNKSPSLAINYYTADADDSIDLLFTNLKSLTFAQFCGIKLMGKTNDNSPLINNFANPFYLKQMDTQNNDSISGLHGSYLQSILLRNDDRLQMQEERHKDSIERIIKDFENKQYVEKLKDEIEYLKSKQHSVIGDIVEQVKEPIIGLIGAIATKFLDGQSNDNTLPAQQPQVVLPPVVASLSNHYGDYESMIGELAILAKNNPEGLNQLRLIMNQAARESIQNKENEQNNNPNN